MYLRVCYQCAWTQLLPSQCSMLLFVPFGCTSVTMCTSLLQPAPVSSMSGGGHKKQGSSVIRIL